MSLLDHFQGGGLPKKKTQLDIGIAGFFSHLQNRHLQSHDERLDREGLTCGGLAKQINAIKKQQKHMAKVHQNSMHYQT